LTMVSDEQVVKTFRVLEKMTFTPISAQKSGKAQAKDDEFFYGAIDAVIGQLPGADIGQAAFNYIFVPLLLGTRPVLIKGQCGAITAEVNRVADAINEGNSGLQNVGSGI